MWFNSVEFAVFLPVVFLIYWFIVGRNLKAQNIFLVLASYVFYGWWDWRFLFLMIFSSLVDYGIGVGLSRYGKPSVRKLLLVLCLAFNIGLLSFFKYYNFFVQSFVDAFTFFGVHLHPSSLNVILPVGISFYTFQTMGYVIDVYRRKVEPTRNIIAYLAFVSFFPQLVAGPIERARNLLPQFMAKRTFDYPKAVDGMRQILWGLFKKIVIADNCATLVQDIYSNVPVHSGLILLLGAMLFIIQVYADFSGYSDIAIGAARLFGFSIMRNFAYPFFSRNMAEFWRRWHISLSTWFRDYVFFSLGIGVNLWKRIRNTLIVFFLIGLWHGASWNFVLWGMINAVYVIPYMITRKGRKMSEIVASGRLFPSFREAIQVAFTFLLFSLTAPAFRIQGIHEVFAYYKKMFLTAFNGASLIEGIHYAGQTKSIITLGLVVFMISFEWIQRTRQHPLEFHKTPVAIRWLVYYLLIFAMIYFQGPNQEFVYFQF